MLVSNFFLIIKKHHIKYFFIFFLFYTNTFSAQIPQGIYMDSLKTSYIKISDSIVDFSFIFKTWADNIQVFGKGNFNINNDTIKVNTQNYYISDDEAVIDFVDDTNNICKFLVIDENSKPFAGAVIHYAQKSIMTNKNGYAEIIVNRKNKTFIFNILATNYYPVRIEQSNCGTFTIKLKKINSDYFVEFIENREINLIYSCEPPRLHIIFFDKNFYLYKQNKNN